MSRSFLAKNPVCLSCEAIGKATPATRIGFALPHKGDRRLFFDTRRWIALCADCHETPFT